MATKTAKKWKLGDEAEVRLGATVWRALVVEDRGHLGVGGRRLWRVQLLAEAQDPPLFVEVPEEDMEVPPR
ncbi:MAG TPA: hypothetical protein VIL86_09415 [Tepidisphaeraceae bacterium]|jgi:hypothetical protein